MSELKIQQDTLHRELVDGSSRIKRYLSRHAADATEVADFYQESIARVLERAREEPIRNPVAYAIRVARNLIINRPALRYVLRNEEERELVCPRPSPEESASRGQRIAQLSRALESMPPLRRSVFIRRRLHGDSRETIARDLGISEEAVKKHISRALCDLQRLLDGQI